MSQPPIFQLDGDDKTDPAIETPDATSASSAFSASSASSASETRLLEVTPLGIASESPPTPLPPRPAGRGASPPSVSGFSRAADESSDPMDETLDALPDLGPLESLMQDPSISEIMVNDTRNVFVEKDGKLYSSRFRFRSNAQVQEIIERIVRAAGKRLDPERPFLDVTLPDGSRANVVLPPLVIGGPTLTIRRFPKKKLTADELLGRGMMDRRLFHFLKACVAGRINLMVCGGTGSGKTTLLNALAEFIPSSERVILIEDTPELLLSHANCVRMQTLMPSDHSDGVYVRDLVANALRMRPDRILIGECRRSEALDMLQAMNTGHSGSMTTLHANTPRDALSRLETLYMMAGMEIPLLAVRRQISNALDLLIHVKRDRSGVRRIVSVCEITGMEADNYTLQELFFFTEGEKAPPGSVVRGGPGSGADATAAIAGRFQSAGLVPALIDRLRERGIDVPNTFFS